ncbi:MAG: DNA polymerase III subunit gamma/tau [Hydrogenophilus sp.]|nr:DNA polymerase III subunit gamma/tau [Hydrogenophilus sp.]
MSQSALARKWRPRDFSSLVGQTHVVRALTYALSTGRLHHAYLFTGTRGVGKTTISRIFAKALNCERGVSPAPCGNCRACCEIDADRYPDYVEMDAASNRGVEEMTALLEQAAYAPVVGRFKIYMIDEVHMLTGHAFNAMLKTLEEPPEHVKFILATTDPQKVPVTILSRCLQLNLRALPSAWIADRLAAVLEEERIPFERDSLSLIAQAARGSMRDALSLLDLAIAYGGGRVETEVVYSMLGWAPEGLLVELLIAMAQGDAPSFFAIVQKLADGSVSGDALLGSLAALIHRLALRQFGAEALEDPRLEQIAAEWHPEFIQLAYEIVVAGRRDLPQAPDEATGVRMTLLRLFAFAPQDEVSPRPLFKAPTPLLSGSIPNSSDITTRERVDPQGEKGAVSQQLEEGGDSASNGLPKLESQIKIKAEGSNKCEGQERGGTLEEESELGARWYSAVVKMDINGLARNLAWHSAAVSDDGERLWLTPDQSVAHILIAHPEVRERLQRAYDAVMGTHSRRLCFSEAAATGKNTPAARSAAIRERMEKELLSEIEWLSGIRLLAERLKLRPDPEHVELDGERSHNV